MKLGFSPLTWQHSWLCLWLALPTLSQGMISSVWALQRSTSGLMWKSQQLPGSLVCGVRGSDCMGLWFPCRCCLLEKPLRSSSGCWDTRLVTRRQSAAWRRLGLCWFSTDRMGTYFVFPQAGHGSENLCLEGKMVFSQGIWGPRDSVQHQRLIVQGVSYLHFVLVVSSVKRAAAIHPLPLLSLASVSSCVPGKRVLGAPITSENHSYVFRASAEHAVLHHLLLMLWKGTHDLVYFVPKTGVPAVILP